MVELRDAVLDSPLRAFALFTVREAISSAFRSERPCRFTLFFTFWYCRARFVPFFTPRGGMTTPYPVAEAQNWWPPMAYIWIRSTGNWSDEAAFRAQLQPSFEPYLERWEETFEMPFRQFRARVYEIAQANLAEVRGAQLAEWDDIPDGALVMPVDDDDWFAPEAAEVLERVRTAETPAYVWEASFAEVPTWAGAPALSRQTQARALVAAEVVVLHQQLCDGEARRQPRASGEPRPGKPLG